MSVLERISPEKFWEEFALVMKKGFKDKSKWEFVGAYQKDAEWTELLSRSLEQICKQFGMKSSREHWPRIDMKFFDRDDVDEWSDWSVEAMIEYENQPFPAWHDEASKLMQMLSGIKVIISYYNEDDYRKGLLQELESFKSIYKSRKYHQTNDNWLFIFGPNAEIWEKRDFIAFKFDGVTISNITDSKSIFH